jgi:DNA mismatch endonuclease, patch repair protein
VLPSPIAVRRAAHRLGYRFCLHRRELPGSPNLVFPARRKATFIHGCFWHQHPRAPDCLAALECRLLEAEARPKHCQSILRNSGQRDGRVLVIWDCETKDDRKLCGRLKWFLNVG